ncbi:MAG: hypothetical protein RLY93_02865 [Sumerlaeia bacterium]
MQYLALFGALCGFGTFYLMGSLNVYAGLWWIAPLAMINVWYAASIGLRIRILRRKGWRIGYFTPLRMNDWSTADNMPPRDECALTLLYDAKDSEIRNLRRFSQAYCLQRTKGASGQHIGDAQHGSIAS